MTDRSVQRNTVANRDFFAFSGPTPFFATGPVVGTSLATSLLTAVAGFGILEVCACGCGGRCGGSVVGNGGVGSCLLASCSLWLLVKIPETSTSSSSSSGQSAIRHRHLLPGSSASFRSLTPSGFSSEEAPCEVWPLFFVGATTGLLPASRLACSDSSSIASQSTLEGSSSTGSGCAS
jgi:hypothetical protein